MKESQGDSVSKLKAELNLARNREHRYLQHDIGD